MRTLLLSVSALAVMTSFARAEPVTLTAGEPVATGPDSANRAHTMRYPRIAAELDRPFVLALGQTANLAAEHLTIVFSRVVEDSRCPTDVECVWAGNAKIELRLAGSNAKPASLYLNTMLSPRTAAYGDYQLSLLSLQPYPSAKFGPPKTYSATLLVQRR